MKTHKGKHGRQIPGPGVGGGGATQHRVNTPSWPTPSPDTLRNVASHEHESHLEAGRPRFSGFVYWLFQSFQEEDCVRNQLLSKTGLWGERGVDRGGSGAKLVAQVPTAWVGVSASRGQGPLTEVWAGPGGPTGRVKCCCFATEGSEGGCSLSLERAGYRQRECWTEAAVTVKPEGAGRDNTQPLSSPDPCQCFPLADTPEQVRSHGGQPPGQGWVENGWRVGEEEGAASSPAHLGKGKPHSGPLSMKAGDEPSGRREMSQTGCWNRAPIHFLTDRDMVVGA